MINSGSDTAGRVMKMCCLFCLSTVAALIAACGGTPPPRLPVVPPTAQAIPMSSSGVIEVVTPLPRERASPTPTFTTVPATATNTPPTAPSAPVLPTVTSVRATPSATAIPTPVTKAAPTPTIRPTATVISAPTSATCPHGCTTPPPGCLIKGNISSSGEKIYHLPGQRNYEATIIDPAKGERWFCTEDEAVANGWRKSKT